jgi:hypothetical protein
MITNDECFGSRRRIGFTLVEVLVAAGLLVLVLGTTYELLTGGGLAFSKGSDLADLLRNGSIALERMTKEIEESQRIERPPVFYTGVPTSECTTATRIGVRSFVDAKDPANKSTLYRVGPLVEFISRPSKTPGCFDLVRIETPDKKTAKQLVLLTALLAENAEFEVSPNLRTVSIRLTLRQPRTVKGFKGTVELRRTAFLLGRY